MPFPYNITSIRLSLASGLSISPAGLEEANSYVMNYRVSTWQRRRWHAEGLLGTEAASGQQSDKQKTEALESLLVVGFKEAGCSESYSYKETNFADHLRKLESRSSCTSVCDENAVLTDRHNCSLVNPRQFLS